MTKQTTATVGAAAAPATIGYIEALRNLPVPDIGGKMLRRMIGPMPDGSFFWVRISRRKQQSVHE
jgi:hypothetical protein